MVLRKIIKNILYFFINIIEKIELAEISLDESDISKKILNTLDYNVNVLSDTGLSKTSHIHITQPYTIWELKLDNNTFLECADNHIVFNENLQEIFVKDLSLGDYILTKTGLSKVIKLNKTSNKVCMYDLTIDNKEHRYYTNDILSHNTINAAITMLHYVTFNNDKNVMIVANIAATTVEIVDKIKSIYSLLPFFLKSGIKIWNQKTITFDNGCRIKSSARSKTPAIGFTIDFLYIDEFAHIPANIIENYYTAVYPVVSAIENSKIIITSTPNGMNKFYQILFDAERDESDPQKNSFKSLRVYWHQVPGRFVTYCRLNPYKLKEFDVSKDNILEQMQGFYSDRTSVVMKYDTERNRDVIHVFNNKSVSSDEVKATMLKINGEEVSINRLAEVTTWKEETIKNIGGEDAFNQEFDLRFINGSRSLLNEVVVNKMMEGKKDYIHERIDELDYRLKFSYDELKFINDPEIFTPLIRKNIRVIASIDISEGLGQDYSVLNLFRIMPKSEELIERTKEKFTHISDFFCLVQFGIYRCNWVSVRQFAELVYCVLFEYFDPANVKAVIELNNYGNEFLAHMPGLFEGNNEYGSYIFFKYKHRADATDEKIGLKIGDNKNMMVKSYQDHMTMENFIINNETTIKEITTFVKKETSSGNIKYCADIGNDDTVMTVIEAGTVFEKTYYKSMVEEYAESQYPELYKKYSNWLNINVEYTQSTDYSALIEVNRERRLAQQYKSSNYGTNPYGKRLF